MSHPAASAPLLLSGLAWGVYMLLYEVLAKTIQSEADLDQLDTAGVVWGDNVDALGLRTYVCPKLHRDDESTRKSQVRVGLGFGGRNPKPSLSPTPSPSPSPSLSPSLSPNPGQISVRKPKIYQRSSSAIFRAAVRAAASSR